VLTGKQMAEPHQNELLAKLAEITPDIEGEYYAALVIENEGDSEAIPTSAMPEIKSTRIDMTEFYERTNTPRPRSVTQAVTQKHSRQYQEEPSVIVDPALMQAMEDEDSVPNQLMDMGRTSFSSQENIGIDNKLANEDTQQVETSYQVPWDVKALAKKTPAPLSDTIHANDSAIIEERPARQDWKRRRRVNVHDMDTAEYEAHAQKEAERDEAFAFAVEEYNAKHDAQKGAEQTMETRRSLFLDRLNATFMKNQDSKKHGKAYSTLYGLANKALMFKPIQAHEFINAYQSAVMMGAEHEYVTMMSAYDSAVGTRKDLGIKSERHGFEFPHPPKYFLEQKFRIEDPADSDPWLDSGETLYEIHAEFDLTPEDIDAEYERQLTAEQEVENNLDELVSLKTSIYNIQDELGEARMRFNDSDILTQSRAYLTRYADLAGYENLDNVLDAERKKLDALEQRRDQKLDSAMDELIAMRKQTYELQGQEIDEFDLAIEARVDVYNAGLKNTDTLLDQERSQLKRERQKNFARQIQNQDGELVQAWNVFQTAFKNHRERVNYRA